MLKYRIIIGPALIALLIGVFWIDDRLDGVVLTGWLAEWLGRDSLPAGLVLFAMGGLILPFAALELTEILRANHIPADRWLTIVSAEMGMCCLYFTPDSLTGAKSSAVVATAFVLMFVIALVNYSRRQNVEGVVAAAGGAMLAMIYLGLMLGFLLALRRWHSAWLILAIILVTKSCDTGAYFFGRWFGKHKLIPWLSPGKTWEGLAGGLLVSTIVAILLGFWGRQIGIVEYPGGTHDFRYTLSLSIAAGILFGLVGHLGDLAASLLKRDAGIKDASSIVPGFGGVLDIVDSPLLVAPLAYWLLGS